MNRLLRKRYGHMAPAALREEGFKIDFYSSDLDERPHVHVRHGDGEAKFWLTPISLDWAEGLKEQEIKRAQKLIQKRFRKIMQRWRRHLAARKAAGYRR